MSLYQQPGSEVWTCEFEMKPFGRVRRSTGTSSRKEAETFERDLRKEYADRAKEKVGMMTLAEAFTRYAKVIQAGTSDGRNYALAANRICEGFGFNVMLDSITTGVIATWRDRQLDQGKRIPTKGGACRKLVASRTQGLSPASVNAYLKLLRTVLRRAHSDWKTLLAVPHFQMAKVPKRRGKDQKPPRYISEDEQRRLLVASPLFLRHFLLFLLGTGARKSEALTLTWDQFDNLFTDNAQAQVRFEHAPEEGRRTKGGVWRTVPLPEYVREMLVRMRQAQQARGYTGNRVFLGKNRLQQVAEVKSMDSPFEFARRKAGLEGAVAGERISLHSMRHTYASRLAMAGVPLEKIRDLLGHSRVEMTEIYAKLCPSTLSPAVAHLEAFGRMELAPGQAAA